MSKPKRSYGPATEKALKALDRKLLEIAAVIEETYGVVIERVVLDRNGLPQNDNPLRVVAAAVVTKEWYEANK